MGSCINTYRGRERETGSVGATVTVLVCPHQWHQEELMFSAEICILRQRLIFSLLVPWFCFVLFFQKPWVYDLWEVWNGYPRQVSPPWYNPFLMSALGHELNCPWVKSELPSYSLSMSVQFFGSFPTRVYSSLFLTYLSHMSVYG